MIHTNWIAVFNSIIDEDNFYRRKGLIELLETYVNQDVLQTGSLQFDGQIMTNSYLNTNKFLLLRLVGSCDIFCQNTKELSLYHFTSFFYNLIVI